jgi:hypothetical protein
MDSVWHTIQSLWQFDWGKIRHLISVSLNRHPRFFKQKVTSSTGRLATTWANITSLLGVAKYTFWWWILKVRPQLPIGVQLQLLLHRAPFPKYWGFIGNRKWCFGDFSAKGRLVQFLMMDSESSTPTSYWCSIVTFVLSRTIPEILRFYWKPEMTFWWFLR